MMLNWTVVQTANDRIMFRAHMITAKPWTLIIKEYDLLKPYFDLTNPMVMSRVLEHLILGGMSTMPILYWWDAKTGLHRLHYTTERNSEVVKSYHYVKIADTLETFEVLYG